MAFSDGSADGGRHHAAVIGLVVGLSAALPMYLWRSDPKLAVAGFVIFGYTAWLWAATRVSVSADRSAQAAVALLPINRWWRRLGRLLASAEYWWSLMFGCATVTGSLWYAGLKASATLSGIAGVWCVIALCLNFSLTLAYPTTRCRRCGYQLAGHLRFDEPDQVVKCSECGSTWTKAQLCLVAPGANRAKAA